MELLAGGGGQRSKRIPVCVTLVGYVVAGFAEDSQGSTALSTGGTAEQTEVSPAYHRRGNPCSHSLLRHHLAFAWHPWVTCKLELPVLALSGKTEKHYYAPMWSQTGTQQRTESCESRLSCSPR